MNPQYLFMGTADTLLETFWFLADSNKLKFVVVLSYSYIENGI